MNVAQTFSDPIRLKAVAIALAGYLVLSVVLFAIVFQFWMPSGASAQQLQQLAEADHTLLLWQDVLGTVLAILCGYLAARISGGHGLRNSLATGALLTMYGVLGIYLHPNHPALMQIGKILSPIPLALLGGWIAMRRGHSASWRESSRR